LGDRADPRTAAIAVDGAPVPTDPTLRYFALHKPAGVTTTLRDRHAERSLAEYLPPGPRVFPVGRLDRPSEGLLLLTNDGRLAHRIQHPRYAVQKEYLAEVDGRATRQAALRLVRGIELDDGVAQAVRAAPVPGAGGRSAMRVVMVEGRKREVRRMLGALGLPVRRLVRTRIGPVTLGDLPEGSRRELTAQEVLALYAAGASGSPPASSRVAPPRRALKGRTRRSSR
jgi:23S rRNA pseudouridine2605 synthase